MKEQALTEIILEALSKSTTVGIGGYLVIYATCKDQENIITCPELTWSISDSTIANLEKNDLVPNSCFITGIYSGSVEVWANVNDITSNKISITVTGPSLNTIDISPKTSNININKSITFSAICKDQHDDTLPICPTLTWNSSNPLVGTIDHSGVFTGFSAGMTEITASSYGITSNIASIKVSVIDFNNILLIGGLTFGIYFISKKLLALKAKKTKILFHQEYE